MAFTRALSRRLTLTLSAGALLAAFLLSWAALQKHETTLEIRPVSQGATIPDGFSVWHHLDANGIRFKSITPQDDILLIKFDDSNQSEAARKVLYRSLPRGFVIAQQEEKSLTPAWLTRLRHDIQRLG
ncbi:EnvZ/OmpR regulon moderator MzrA [Cronobacter universalis]|uniref:Modulator protein MzrA n=1 Tax=Cronobacter universalis NCTC 9529 TaxID=1074000 RepID=A0AAC8VMJ7_9ENTR|nr:EnvZ/OmpR regulon moderator MzrA [Cronobacter universalis]ALB53568.1 Modulator protein MzrA [Cronobacter universalis NCTC 9529]ELY3466142.1 EnvZ/OmpR regulon moderator MzrA [Cronobacter universalis]ELY3761354.1 EnvZ/OmpR regulon moderator MzrA [Cronobacter universalis]ELY6246457.1 EnvZ/OmpR regulon moderator MzrA [Cronobacter universalis]ELY7391485.1 EnvZ/OmpR regulon moderator MzrA [Cronobacter universalis]